MLPLSFFPLYIPPFNKMPLESLPPELLTMILKNINSLPNLRKLISASPACLRVFNSASKHILPTVIRKGIPPRVLKRLDRHLKQQSSETRRLESSADNPDDSRMDACIDRHLKRQASETQRLGLSLDDQTDGYVDMYIKSYIQGCVDCGLSSSEYSDSAKASIWHYRRCRLYERLSYLTKRYTTRLKGLGLDTTTFISTPYKPTSLEKVFLRYDTLTFDPHEGIVSASRKPLLGDLYHAVIDYNIFLARLGLRDVEKIICAELYASLFKRTSISR